jgi:hypothetical protein
MGMFSVDNLFEGIKKAVSDQFKFLEYWYIKLPQQIVGQIQKALGDPLSKLLLQILSITIQITQAFKTEIRQLSNFIEKVPGTIAGRIEKYVASSLRTTEKNVQKLLKPALDAASTTKKQIEALRKLEGDIRNPQKLVKIIQQPFNDVLKNITKTVSNGSPVKNLIDAGIKEGNKVLTKNPLIKTAIRFQTPAVEVMSIVLRKPSVVTETIGFMPKLIRFFEPFVGPAGKSLKALGKAVPIIGEFQQAIDQQFLENEIKDQRKQLTRMEATLNTMQSQILAKNLAEAKDRERTAELYNAYKQGKLGSGNSVGRISEEDYRKLETIVRNATQSQSPINPQAIATAVVSRLDPRLPVNPATSAQVNQVLTLAQQSFGKMVSVEQLQTKLALEQQKVANSLPTVAAIRAGVKSDLIPLLQEKQVTPKEYFDNAFKVLDTKVNDIRNGVVFGNGKVLEGVAGIQSMTVRLALTATQGQLETVNKGISKTLIDRSIFIDQVVRDEHKETRKQIERSANTVVSSLPKTSTLAKDTASEVSKALGGSFSNLNSGITSAVLASGDAANSARQAKDAALESKQKIDDTYKMVGGDTLKNGIPVNQENKLKEIGDAAFSGGSTLLNTLPGVIAAYQAVSHYRGGLHRLPASLPGSVSDPNTPPVAVTDKLQHDQQLFKLTDEKLGASSPIKTRKSDGTFETSQARNISEALDMNTAQSQSIEQELEITQQMVIKLASETLKVNMIVLQNHSLLEALREFCGFRYSEVKATVPTEVSLGKEGLLDFLTGNTLHYVKTKMDSKFDLTQMLQKQFLETGKISSSFFRRFDPADPNAKVIGEDFSKPNSKEDDDEWKKFVKFLKETPTAVSDDVQPKPTIERYTNNDTTPIDVSGVTLPQG